MSIARVRSQPALGNARFKGRQQVSQQKSNPAKPSPFASGQHCNAMYPESWKNHQNKEALSKQPLYTHPRKTDDPKPEENKPQPEKPENSDKLKDIPKKILDKLGETARKDLPEMLEKGLAKLENGVLVFGGAALLGKKVLDKTLQYWQRFSNCGLEAGCNLKKVFLMSEQYAKAEKEKPGSGLEAV